jgi:hypothetical protein
MLGIGSAARAYFVELASMPHKHGRWEGILRRCFIAVVLDANRYLKLGFGGAHTDSNQRLMYTSA